MTRKIPLAGFQPIIYLLPQQISDHQTWVCELLTEHHCSQHPLNDSQVYWVNRQGENLAIESIRDLITELSYVSFKDSDRYVIILNLSAGTPEAQNALLKTLEEPPAKTQFIMTSTQLSSVLSTVRSRSLVENLTLSAEIKMGEAKENLFSFASLGEAIQVAEKFKDREEARVQLQEWLSALSQTDREKNWPKIKLIQQALKQLKQNGNVKLILENCFFQILTLAPAL